MTDAPAIKQNANGVYFLEGEQLWDSDILPVCLEHIKEGDTVIDAGAWIGGHTMAYAEKVGETGMVWAFEPNLHAWNCLELNTEKFKHVSCHNVALGDKEDIVEFTSKTGWYDSGHVGNEEELVGDVCMDKLDDYNTEPNFIKIDVEGCELKVLNGAEKTIDRHRPIMVIEINEPALERQGNASKEVFDWLLRKGYDWKKIGTDSIFNILAISE